MRLGPSRRLLAIAFLLVPASAAATAAAIAAQTGAAAEPSPVETPVASRDVQGPLRERVEVPDYLKLERSWNVGSHCGTNSLYVISNLAGLDVSLSEVEARLPIDPATGCSMEEIRVAAAAIGLPGEVRLVSAEDLTRLPRPFILHLAATESRPETGHFVTVFDYAPRGERHEFGVIDGTTGEIEYVEPRHFYRSYSGYVFVPGRIVNAGILRILRAGIAVLAVLIVALAVRLLWLQRSAATGSEAGHSHETEGGRTAT